MRDTNDREFARLTNVAEGNTYGLKQETSDKLHPPLVLFLKALRTLGKQSESAGPRAACAGFLANSLHAVRTLQKRENVGLPLVGHEDSATASLRALVSEIIQASRLVPGRTSARLLATAPEFFDEPTVTKLSEIGDEIHRNASPEAHVFTGSMRKAIGSVRSNRSPQSAFQKFSHEMILMFLFLFGALKRTGSDLSLGVLTPRELKEVFDYACPACHENHSSEALRKNSARFVEDILRRWPASKKGTCSRPRTIEVKHLGLAPRVSQQARRPFRQL
jgi:hypothetical protein